MSYNADIVFSLGEAEKLLKDLEELLEEVKGADGADRRALLREIDQKLARANEYISGAQLDIADLADPDLIEQYTEQVNTHEETWQRLSTAAKEAGKQAQLEEQARAKGVTTQDLMSKSTAIQEKDKQILSNVSKTLDEINNMGNEQLAEMERQKEKLAQSSQHMSEMDSELKRARKILKVMITRAAGDNCIRVLAALVIIAVIVVVVVDQVKPGSIKQQTEGWFNNG